MCTRYADAQCCVCRRYLDQSSNRIIVEICGHQKCRECFIKEEDGCSLCKQKCSSEIENEQQFSNEIYLRSSGTIASSSEPVKGVTIKDACTENSLTIDLKDDDALHIITTNETGDTVRYKCTICQKTFKSRNNRKYHLFCDKTRSKPFQCSQCDKQFITLAHMNYHQSTHNTNNHFACKHCPKVYSGDIALKKHMRKHQNIFKYQCSQCDEKFLYKEQLNIHQNRHNNIFHKCPECGKRFLIKSNLTKHILSHSGLNRKVCTICKNTFSGNSALKTHMLTHSKSKSYLCEKCSKKFIDQRTLERHWKTHLDNAFYECTLCSAKSGRKDNIRRHVRNLHSESDDELQKILEKIFANFEKKKNMPATYSNVVREKTEKEEAAVSDRVDEIEKNGEIPVPESNIVIEEPIKSAKVVRNIATSVIKFVGRSQNIQVNHKNEENNSKANELTRFIVDNTEEIQIEPNLLSSAVVESRTPDPIAEIGVSLPSLEPLNYDPFPDIAPLPLINTNTNLTVYRQLLSPYLKNKQSTANCESNVLPQHSPNGRLKSSSTAMVIDRPPKKMIEKYEIYRK